jgi:transcriptional regulator with XRE-family HTH domain
MREARFPETVVAMITEGSTMAKAFRHHAGLPIQYVALRSGITVGRLAGIESGSHASQAEIDAIGKALNLPCGVLGR